MPQLLTSTILWDISANYLDVSNNLNVNGNTILKNLNGNGTAGQVLTSNGASPPTWVTPAGSGNATTIDISDNDTGTFYPTFVSGSGSGKTLSADTTGTPLQFVLTAINKEIKTTTTSTTTNQQLKLGSYNTGIGSQQSYIEINSGNNTSAGGYINMKAQNIDGDISSNLTMSDSQYWARYSYYDGGGESPTYTAGFRSNLIAVNQLNSCMYSDDGTGAGTAGIKVSGSNVIDMFINGTGFTDSTANVASFNSGGQILFYRPLTFSSNNGLIEKSITKTISATTTFTTENLFLTTIISTSANRIITLPTLTAGSNIGYWYGICNKSSFTLTIQTITSPGPPPVTTTLATIGPSSATSAGNSARFAVAAGGVYFSPGQ